MMERRLSRWYRAVLGVLPADFRGRRGGDLARLFDLLVGEARTRGGRAAALACFVRESGDVLATGLRLRLTGSTGNGRRRMRKPGMDLLAHDVRLAARGLRLDKGFTVVVVVTLALGIGATTALFSVVNGVLLRPLPFAAPERLVHVWQNDRETGTVREPSSWPDYLDLQTMNRSFTDVAAYGTSSANLTRSDGDPARVRVASVSSNLASTLGVSPAVGRTITPDEARPGGAKVALLSDGYWTEALGRDLDVLGTTLVLDDEPYTVIGVLPPGLDFPEAVTDAWVPLQTDAELTPRYTHPFQVVARLAPGASVATAQDDVTAIMAQLEAQYPENEARGGFVETFPDVIRGSVSRPLMILFGAVFTVLLVACANVANLFLARGARRTHELAIYTALGATRGRLARRFLIESVLLTGAASVAGMGLAVVGLRATLAVAPPELLALGEVGLDGGVFAFAIGIVVVVTLGFALVPVRQARRLDVQTALKEGRAQSGAGAMEKLRARRILVVSQMALAMVLLVGAGLLLNSLWRLQSVDPGFRTDSILRVEFQLPPSRYPRDFSQYPDWTEVHAFNQGLVERTLGLPGVESATVVGQHSLDPGFTNSFLVEGRESEASEWGELTVRLVGPDYFDVSGLRVVEGRPFDFSDDASAPTVAMVNRAAVARYFPDHPVLGERLGFWGMGREIVGIVEDERIHGLTEATPPAVYVSMLQAPQAGRATLMVRSARDPMTLVEPIRAAVSELDPLVPIYNVGTMEGALADSMARERFTSLMFAIFAAVGLLIAIIGVHGVLSYLVAQRGHEVGVRMALGASRGQVRRMIVAQGMGLAVAGIGLGILAAAGLSGLLSGLLFEVSATDPITYAVVAAVLAATAAAASAMPARRATRIDPVEALRSE